MQKEIAFIMAAEMEEMQHPGIVEGQEEVTGPMLLEVLQVMFAHPKC